MKSSLGQLDCRKEGDIQFMIFLKAKGLYVNQDELDYLEAHIRVD